MNQSMYQMWLEKNNNERKSTIHTLIHKLVLFMTSDWQRFEISGCASHSGVSPCLFV